MNLCAHEGCRKLRYHGGGHDCYPASPWAFMANKDKDKLAKAGFATPRGGAKGAYQNHVLRSNKVIIPFERMSQAPIGRYESGYVIRIFPDQYFDVKYVRKAYFDLPEAPKIGLNAFLLYRTHHQLVDFPPPDGWRVRSLTLDGAVINERVYGAVDVGEYVLRIAAHGNKAARNEGPPQGIFAPEYANERDNYLAKCVLAWLTVQTLDSPYVAGQAMHVEKILEIEGILKPEEWEAMGMLRAGFASCPLCLKLIKYQQLHDQVSFADEQSVLNASEQVLNSTRSTIVNLFHINPLTYSDVEHTPDNVAWGHAICNTKLGQRKCYSYPELVVSGSKVGTIMPDGTIASFGWITKNLEMIRSPGAATWIRIVEDHLSMEKQSALIELVTKVKDP